jgi:TonB family protein
MASTTEAGSVEVPAVDGGGNMFADPKDDSLPTKKGTTPTAPPEEKGDGKGGYQITEEPQFLTPESERAPPYPREAKTHEIEGTVLLRVYVSVDGTITEVKVMRPLGGECTQAAVKWARTKWKFSPALAGSEPVGMWITVPVRFVLER